MNGDEFNSINRALGSIEAKQDSQAERFDNLMKGIFGEGGIEKRLSKLEIAMAVIKGNKALVITVITLVASMAGFLILLFGTGVAK